MRVGLMTWFTYHNYGTALQLTALYETLRSFDHDVMLLNYNPSTNIQKPMIFIRILRRIRRYFRKFILRSETYRPYSNYERENKFNEFINENISMTNECNTQYELERIANSFDVIVCGSDQIWSPLCFNPHYYLDFVHDLTKKIAYAPSIDPEHVRSEAMMQRIIELAGEFDSISVREVKAAEILSLWLHRDVKAVLDPTLLFDAGEWEKFISESGSRIRKQCLVYMLGHDERHWQEVYRISERLNLEVKIIPVFAEDLKREGCINYPIGPREFLSLFRNADFVCTDSFHGMLFSIIFHVNFIEFKRFMKYDPRNQNFRVFNIAGLLSLEDRITDCDVADDVLFSRIDFCKVDAKLNELRKDSLSWLKSALS